MSKFVTHHFNLMINAVKEIEHGMTLLKNNLLVLLGYFDDESENQSDFLKNTHSTTIMENEFPCSFNTYVLSFNSDEVKTNGKKSKSNAYLLSEFFYFVFLPHKLKQGRFERTLKKYKHGIKVIINGNFDKPLDLYTTKEIVEFIKSTPEQQERQLLKNLFKNLFNLAITKGIIQRNLHTVTKHAIHTQRKRMVISFDGQSEFFKLLISNKHLSYADKCYFIFVYFIGTTSKETTTITVSDVDFKNKVINVRDKKTYKPSRRVPLIPIVEKLLLSLKIKKGRYFKFSGLLQSFVVIQICLNKLDKKTALYWLRHFKNDQKFQLNKPSQQVLNMVKRFLNRQLKHNKRHGSKL